MIVRRRDEHYSRELRPASVRSETCVECGAEADEQARGWRGLRMDLDDGEEPEVVFFCPGCAKKEFGRTDELDE